MYIGSFYPSGLHDTPNNILKKDKAGINTAGININRNFRKFFLGISYVGTSLSEPYFKNSDTRSVFDFEGCNNRVISAEGAILMKQSYIFGEYAIDNDGGFALVQGFGLSPGGRIILQFLWIHSSRQFTSIHGKSQGIDLFNNPGNAFMTNLRGELTGELSFSGGFLFNRDLWYNNNSGYFPVSYKSGIRLNYDPGKNYTVNLELKNRVSDEWPVPDQGIRLSERVSTYNCRINLALNLTDNLSLKSRFETCFVHGKEDSGYIFYESADYRFKGTDLRLIARWCIFSTASWNTRIYAWEDDLLYNPVINPLYGRGASTYLLMVFKPVASLAIRFKYSFISARNRDSTNDFKIQLVYDF
jgi:hypothetical protein